MLDLVLNALQTLFSPDHFAYLVLGVLLGLIIGVFPGLGGIAGLCSLSGKSLVKGVLACGFGLIVGSIGAAPATGEYRMIFGVDYLYDGLPLVIIALSIFAFPEISELFRKDAAIGESVGLGSGGWTVSIRDMIKHKWLALRINI